MHSSVSPFNFVTLTAFLAWFGGTGYLLTRFSSVWVGLGLLFSVISGLIGGGIIFLFLSKVLMSDEENMDPADHNYQLDNRVQSYRFFTRQFGLKPVESEIAVDGGMTIGRYQEMLPGAPLAK